MINRKEIIPDFILKLQTVTRANGYLTDLGTNAHDWTEKPLSKKEFPEAIVKDIQNSFSDGSTHVQTITIEVVLFTANSENTVTELRKMIADVYLMIGNNKSFFYNKYDGMYITPVSDEIEMFHEDKIVGAASIKIAITFETDKWQP